MSGFTGGGASSLQAAFDGGQTITIADNDNQTLAITQNDVTNDPDALTITVADNCIGRALYIDHNNVTTDSVAVQIDSASTTNGADADALLINSDATTGRAMKIVGDSLTTGSLLWLYSNTTGDNGSLLWIENDNTGGNQKCIDIRQDGNNNVIDLVVARNTTTNIYQSSGTSIEYLTTGNVYDVVVAAQALTTGQAFSFDYTKTSSSFTAKTGAWSSITTNRTNSKTSGTLADDFDMLSIVRTDVTTGAGGTTTAAGSCLRLETVATQSAGTLTHTVKGIELVMDADGTGNGIYIDHNNTGDSAALVIDSEAATNTTLATVDINAACTTGTAMKITVDSLTSGNGLWVYSNSNQVGGNLVFIENDNTGTKTCLHIQQDAAEDALFINHTAASGSAIDVNADAVTGAIVVDITSATLDAGTGLVVDCDALTTGLIADFRSNSSDATARSLVQIKNDHASATGTTPLKIQQDAPTSTNFKKYIALDGTTIYVSDQTDPEGNLTGVQGDICLNGPGGDLYFCDANGTNWTAT